MNTYDIDGVEIFAVGKWNGSGFSAEDLDNLVKAFEPTKQALKPYLKIGHSETQKLLERDSLPAAGWLENLRRVGDKLVADFKRVPKKVYDLIQAGAYARVSAEIYENLEWPEGKVWPMALKAVSILGGETPAVATLDDIISLYGLDLAAKPAVFESKSSVKTYDFERNQEEQVDKELAKAQADLAVAQKEGEEAKAKVVELTKNLETVTTERDEAIKAKAQAEADFAAANEKIITAEREKKHAEIKATVERLVTEKKIVPAQRDRAEALLQMSSGMDARKFKLGDKEYTAEGLVLEFMNSGAALVPPTDPASEAGDKSKADEVDRIKKYAEENKVSFKDAMLHFAREAAKASEKTGESDE